MQLATLVIQLHIPHAQSLKAKRQVITGIKSRLRNKFNISIAEVGDHDLWQKCTLGIAVIAGQRRFLDQVLDQIENYVAL